MELDPYRTDTESLQRQLQAATKTIEEQAGRVNALVKERDDALRQLKIKGRPRVYGAALLSMGVLLVLSICYTVQEVNGTKVPMDAVALVCTTAASVVYFFGCFLGSI